LSPIEVLSREILSFQSPNSEGVDFCAFAKRTPSWKARARED